MRYTRLIDLNLIRACKKGDARAVKKLLRKGADPNCRSGDSLEPTPILIAALYGDTDIIAILIQHGADPYATDSLGRNALHYAVAYRRYDTAQYLITQLHFDPNIKDRDGVDPFLIAAGNGDIKMLKRLIELGANPYTTDNEGRNALHYATKKGHYHIVEYLITQLQFDPNAQDKNGFTPLIIATQEVDIQMLKLLIQLGANPYITNHRGQHAIHYAVRKRDLHIVEYLIAHLQLDPNIKDNNGVTPFMCAAEEGDVRMLELLLKLGADPYAKDCCGRSALHYAAESRSHHAVKYLITHLHLNPNTQDQGGASPIDLSANFNTVQQFIQLGAHPNISIYGDRYIAILTKVLGIENLQVKPQPSSITL